MLRAHLGVRGRERKESPITLSRGEGKRTMHEDEPEANKFADHD